MNRIFALALAVVLLSGQALAQGNTTAKVVTACGTPPFTYQLGASVSLLVDSSGNLCSSATGGGGGGAVTQGAQAGTATGNTWFFQGVGTAGSPSGGVISANVVSDSLGLAQGSTTSGQVGPLLQAAVNSGIPAYTNGQTSPLTISTAGALRIVQTGLGGNAIYQTMTAGASPTGGGIGSVGVYLSTPPALTNQQGIGLQLNADGSLIAQGRPITPVVSAAGESSHVLKASAGNLISVNATNLTATAGFLVVLNATAAPADGAITPLACQPLPANGSASIAYGSGPPGAYSTGITAVLTSATTCFTKTTGTLTGFIAGQVQ